MTDKTADKKDHDLREGLPKEPLHTNIKRPGNPDESTSGLEEVEPAFSGERPEGQTNSGG